MGNETMLKQTKKVLGLTAAGLTLLATLGSGTLLTLHAANNVSTVAQTAAPVATQAGGTRLTAAGTSGTRQNYSVTYRTAAAKHVATFQKQTFGQAATAAKRVNYIGRHPAGPTVHLTSTTSAVVQGTMGQTYVHWNIGKWSVTAITANADQSGTPTQFANQLNRQLQQRALPARVTSGAITVYSQPNGTAQVNTVKWQTGNQLYSVQGQTATAAVKLAQSAH